MKRSRILFVSSLLQFALLIPLSLWARKHREPWREIALTRLFQKKQTARKRSSIAVLNTLTGSAVLLNILVVPVCAFLWRVRLREEAIAVLATCWSNALGRTALKQVVHRPRPQHGLVRVRKQSRGQSFPSGHVASAICLWGWLFALGLFAKEKLKGPRKLLLALPAALVAFTGPARVYLGDHWATDVLAGYLFGGGWLSLSLSFYLQLRERAACPSLKVPEN